MGAAWGQPGTSSMTAWEGWASIDAAVAIEPLDGPEELSEKAEIIADRRDALTRERDRLRPLCVELDRSRDGVARQAEALRELSTVRNRRDVLLRQRQHALRGRLRELETLSLKCGGALRAIGAAIDEIRGRHARYLEHARRIREEETKRP